MARYRPLFAVAAVCAALVLAVVGCGGGKSAGRQAGNGSHGDLVAPGTVVMVFCPYLGRTGAATGDQPDDVVLYAVSVSTGRTVATRSYSLPGDATESQACSTPDSTTLAGAVASDSSAEQIRQMFDQGFNRVAVTVSDPSGDGTLATAVDTRTGKLLPTVSPRGTDQGLPVFDVTGDDLWYADSGTKEIVSRDLRSGRTTVHGGHTSGADTVAVSHGHFWALGGTGSAVASADWAVSPDGGHVIAGDWGATYLAGAGADLSTGLLPAPRVSSIGSDPSDPLGDDELPGSQPARCVGPEWIDSTHVLCNKTGSAFTLITFSRDLSSVTSVRTDLLPPALERAGYSNFSPVIAPGGRSFAFLSMHGNTVTLYRQDLAPGSTPARIGVVPESPAPDSNPGHGPGVLAPLLLQWN